MGKMSDRFPQIWKLRNDDGSFTHLFNEENVSVFNQAYYGRIIIYDGKNYVCYKIFNRNGKRFGYVVPADSEAAKSIPRIKASVTWDDGQEYYMWCEPNKYMPGKSCEITGVLGTRAFTFGYVLEHTTVYEWNKKSPGHSGKATCVI